MTLFPGKDRNVWDVQWPVMRVWVSGKLLSGRLGGYFVVVTGAEPSSYWDFLSAVTSEKSPLHVYLFLTHPFIPLFLM